MTADNFDMLKAFVNALCLVALVFVLYCPNLIAYYASRRLSRRTSIICMAVVALVGLAGFASLSIPNLYDVYNSRYWGLVYIFMPIFILFGLARGVGENRLKSMHERSLENWRHQLIVDRQADAGTWRLAIDYREISAQLEKLGRREEAIEEYRQAMVIMDHSLKSHPAMAEYYKGYLNLLQSKNHADEIARIKAKLAALPQF